MTDWDDAFDNISHVPNAIAYFDIWAERAKAFRKRHTACDLSLPYGTLERQKLDIFWPSQNTKGLVVFIHGGYWIRLDRSYFSHLAAGPLAHGWAVALPSYTLAPKARIHEITKMVAQAITYAAQKIDGPIRIAGHSAGGHLVMRMMCENTPLARNIQTRIVKTLSISGLHDLRNLRKTALNETLGLTEQEVINESPALCAPVKNAHTLCWVGQHERPEFIRQSHLLAETWTSKGASVDVYVQPSKHHFDILDDLEDSTSYMIKRFLTVI